MLKLNEPVIMGVINATPDSFSGVNSYTEAGRALDRIHIMRKRGAKIIDIGGESTRPGSDPVTAETELARVLPILEVAVKTFPDLIYSVDTTKYEVAEAALNAGAGMINDISGLQKEPRLADLAAEYDVPLIIMHSKGTPKHMQDSPEYEDVVQEVYDFLAEKIEFAGSKGVNHIIVDPGIGFGKNLEHNLKLIAHLDKFMELGRPVMIGASRKSMIGQLLDGRKSDGRVTGTVTVHYDALLKGARFLRVHDVLHASDSVRIFKAIQSQR